MRILDCDNDIAVKNLLLLLSESEAIELIGALEDSLSCKKQVFHTHINDAEYHHEITVGIYEDKDIEKNTFNERTMRLIQEDR